MYHYLATPPDDPIREASRLVDFERLAALDSLCLTTDTVLAELTRLAAELQARHAFAQGAD